jgi:hypothetical protein
MLYRSLAAMARLAVRSDHSKDLEIVVLRHQLGVLRCLWGSETRALVLTRRNGAASAATTR